MSTGEELAAFRAEVRAWIEKNKPERPGFKLPQSFLEVESDPQFRFLRDWQRKVYEAGYLGYDVPEAYGGRGVDPARQAIVSEELVRQRTPFMVNTIGLHWVAPTILVHGTEAQKKKYIRPILSAEEIWCQGFSEPGAGSDLASLETRAEKTADGWRVTGHKVWTTLGHVAKWMILLARTNPDVHKYEGLSYFLCPMDVDGVVVQPLTKMTGEGGFNQVIFDGAPMPADALLGREGEGWKIAMTTLTFERGAAESQGRQRAQEYEDQLQRLADLARRASRDGNPASEDPVMRDRIAQMWIEAEALKLAAARAVVPGLNTERPMALRMMSKLVFSEFQQRLTELACDLLGPEATLWLGDENAPDGAEWPRGFMNSFGFTIGGGTSEIQRNILGERVLGLPKSK